MDINAGDIFYLPHDGMEVSIQTIYSPDHGETWFCCRTDRSLSSTAIVLSADDLRRSAEPGGAENRP